MSSLHRPLSALFSSSERTQYIAFLVLLYNFCYVMAFSFRCTYSSMFSTLQPNLSLSREEAASRMIHVIPALHDALAHFSSHWFASFERCKCLPSELILSRLLLPTRIHFQFSTVHKTYQQEQLSVKPFSCHRLS